MEKMYSDESRPSQEELENMKKLLSEQLDESTGE